MFINFSLKIAALTSTTVHFRIHNFCGINAAAGK